jgi:hypothetical protein
MTCRTQPARGHDCYEHDPSVPHGTNPFTENLRPKQTAKRKSRKKPVRPGIFLSIEGNGGGGSTGG